MILRQSGDGGTWVIGVGGSKESSLSFQKKQEYLLQVCYLFAFCFWFYGVCYGVHGLSSTEIFLLVEWIIFGETTNAPLGVVPGI